LVAFENGHPKFWIETKCSFIEDERDGKTVGRLIPPLEKCPTYIVHFVNTTPKEPRLRPDYVLDKYPEETDFVASQSKQAWHKSEVDRIEAIYAEPRRRRKKAYHSSRVLVLHRAPNVYAIVVKLNANAERA